MLQEITCGLIIFIYATSAFKIQKKHINSVFWRNFLLPLVLCFLVNILLLVLHISAVFGEILKSVCVVKLYSDLALNLGVYVRKGTQFIL